MLSNRVRWVDHAPVASSKDLYYEVEFPSGFRQWVRVLRGARSRRSWWAFHILDNTKAVRITELFA